MDATNRNTALASALVEELARSGVRNAVIAPGSRSTPVALALWREPAIEATVLVDERSAGFVALGAAQASGAPAIVACTSGSAAANLHPAVVEADEAGVGLVVLTSDRPPELRGIGAGQTIDQLKLYGSAVRWFCEVGTHDADDAGLLHMRATACRAFAAARGEPRPGPVHLNLAWREPLAPQARAGEVRATGALALRGRGDQPLTTVSPPSGAPDQAVLDQLAERIAAVPRGLILAGRLPDPGHAAAVAGLARAAGYPILPEPTSQLRLGHHDRELVAWPYDAIARLRPPNLAPDLVLRFGDMPTSKPLRLWVEALPDLEQIVVAGPGSWNEPSRTAARVIRAEPAALATALAGRLGEKAGDGGDGQAPAAGGSAERPRAGAREGEQHAGGGSAEPPIAAGTRGNEHAGAAASRNPRLADLQVGPPEEPALANGDYASAWRDAADAAADAIAAGLAELDRPTEPGVHAALGSLYRDGDLVYTASSMPIRDQEAFLPSGPADARLLCNRGANGIDGLISSGIGAATATGRPTWIVTGDLGLVHDINGLAALRDTDAEVRIVVLDNAGGGIFELLPQAELTDRDTFEALFATPSGLDPGRIAALHDIPHRRVEHLSDLAAAARGTALIEIPIDRATSVAARRRLGERVAAALSAAAAPRPG